MGNGRLVDYVWRGDVYIYDDSDLAAVYSSGKPLAISILPPSITSAPYFAQASSIFSLYANRSTRTRA
jgi:hypothetical protein